MSITFSFKILTTLLGLSLPGYVLARALRLKSSLTVAFPFSALIICQIVTALACTNTSMTFKNVTAIMTILTVIAGIFVIKQQNHPENTQAEVLPPEIDNQLIFKISIVIAVLVTIAAAFRTTLYPLGGFDTFTRWDALAREMLQYSSLSFYPPITGADFSIYTMPDGFPPLVASVYWWLYAATGTVLPQLTAISVTLQLASILGLTWSAAQTALGNKAAAFTLLALTASPLLIRSVEIGQESGFLALAVIGQICFALAAIRRPSLAPVFAAALFAALGALAREYGAALALPGLLILLSNAATRRYAWRYALLAAVLASPWYIRNLVIAGSPLYPLTMPDSAHSNPLLAALMSYYGEIYAVANFGIKEWAQIIYELAAGFSVALLAALPYLIRKNRRFYPYILSLALITLLWLWSVGKTSGGIIYSMRVLAPAAVILALIAGEAFAKLSSKNGWQKHVSWLLIPAALWGVLSALSYPLQPMQLSESLFSTKTEAPEFCALNREFAKRIDSLDISPTGILTDSPYLAVILKRETRFRPVIIWSPEVSFLVDSQIGSKESRQKLLALNIRLVALNRSSVHNNFLSRMSFFKDDFSEWKQLLATEDGWDLFEFPPMPQK